MFFMYDLIISQIQVSWKASLNAFGALPPEIQLGSSVLSKKKLDKIGCGQTVTFDLQKHLNSLYVLYREESVVHMERLWLMYLENLSSYPSIEKKKDWGCLTKKLKELHQELKKDMCNQNMPSHPSHVDSFTVLDDNH